MLCDAVVYSNAFIAPASFHKPTEDQTQQDLVALQKKQVDLWQTLLAKAEAQKGRVEALWQKVEDAQQAVDKERGYDKFNSSWGKFLLCVFGFWCPPKKNGITHLFV